MAEYFVDASTGSDANAGTSGAPFATIQKALDSATGGDIISLANTAVFGLTSQLNFSAFGSTTRDTPLLIRAWDNGGSITIDKPTVGGVAQSIVAAEIDGQDNMSTLFSGSDKWIIFQGIRMQGTTGIVINRLQGWVLYNCEVFDGSGTYLVGTTGGDCDLIDCYIHDDGGSGVTGVQLRNQGTFTGNYIKNVSGHGMKSATTYCSAINNVIDGFASSGIYMGHDACTAIHNTINDCTGASGHGIEVAGGAEFCTVQYNVITDVDTTGAGVYITSGGNIALNGPNAFYNNTTNNGGATNPASCLDLTGSDVSEASSPYEDESSGDFRIATTSGAYEEVLSFGGGIATKSNFGAFSPGKQDSNGGGGGGGQHDPNAPQAWNDGVPV